MALHLIPAGETDHRPSRECPCRPDLVNVPVDIPAGHAAAGESVRQAWQRRGAGDADGVEVAD